MGSCHNSIVLDMPREKVWDAIRDFHDLSWAKGVITKLDVKGDKGGLEIGASRLLNDAFLETLVSVDEAAFTFTYSIDDGPAPLDKGSVSNYLGKVCLSSTDNGGTLVEWSSSYESANEDAIADFCNPIYVALLDAMKASLS